MDELDREFWLQEIGDADGIIIRKGQTRTIKDIFLPGDKPKRERTDDDRRHLEDLAEVLRRHQKLFPL